MPSGTHNEGQSLAAPLIYHHPYQGLKEPRRFERVTDPSYRHLLSLPRARFRRFRKTSLLPPAGFPCFVLGARHGTSMEYLLANNIGVAERAARRQGWHAHGRSGWIKPDGNEVQFICHAEQLAAISKHETIYVVGELSPRLARLDRKWAKLRA